MKKVISLLLSVILMLSCLQLAVCANELQRNQNIAIATYSLSISGINSTSRATMKTATKMNLSIKMELQKIKDGAYATIETWTQSKYGVIIAMEETRLINVLATYRLKVTFTAGNETIIRYAYPE